MNGKRKLWIIAIGAVILEITGWAVARRMSRRAAIASSV